MRENGSKTVKTSTPEPTTPDTTNREIGNNHKGNIKGNFRRGNEGEASWSERKIKGETPKLNTDIGLIT